MWLLADPSHKRTSLQSPCSDVAADFALDSDLGDGGMGVREVTPLRKPQSLSSLRSDFCRILFVGSKSASTAHGERSADEGRVWLPASGRHGEPFRDFSVIVEKMVVLHVFEY